MEKVLHLLPMTKFSGAEKMALLICKNLKEYEPIVITGGTELSDFFEKENIKSYSTDFSLKKILYVIKEIKKIIDVHKIQIVHAHDNTASIYALCIKKILKSDLKIISHVHSAYPFLKKNGVYKVVDSICRPKYDLNIFCGETVLDYYRINAKYLPTSKSIVMSNCIDIETIETYKRCDSRHVREQYNIEEHKIIIGFCGRLCEIKGLVPFIKELRFHIEDFKNCIFFIVGSGELEKEIKSLVHEYNLEYYFRFTGYQSNVYDFYPIMDVFFISSLYEGLPMVILEAMAFEKIVVSMDVGSISEVVKNDRSGYLVESGNYNLFVNTLKLAIKPTQYNNQLKVEGYNNVSKNYSLGCYIETLTSLYSTLVYY